jgi:hypothetical protein
VVNTFLSAKKKLKNFAKIRALSLSMMAQSITNFAKKYQREIKLKLKKLHPMVFQKMNDPEKKNQFVNLAEMSF